MILVLLPKDKLKQLQMTRLLSLFLLFISPFCFCQNTAEEKTIDSQFKDLYRTSSTYKEYKVISIKKYNQLKNNTLKSLNSQKEILNQKTNFIKELQQEITDLKQNLATTEKDLKTAIELKDRRQIFGVTISQFTLSCALIATYSLLLLLLIFFIFKYKKNLNTTKHSTVSLIKLEAEFEDHKKKSLVRFQEVNRKLQDELNKKWNKDK